MQKVALILQKEWQELRQDRGIILGCLLPPLLFTLLPILGVWGAGLAPERPINTNSPVAASPALVGMGSRELAQALIGQQTSTLFVLMPLIVPSVIASYSIVGEKAQRTLEPLLATPIRNWELLMGKSLAALIPAVSVTWLLGAAFVGAMAKLAVNDRVFAFIVTPGWLLILTLCTPLLALIVIALMVAISSRVNDPRTAQQYSGFLIIPFTAVFVGQLAGALEFSPAVVLVGAALLALIAAVSLRGAMHLFRREVILTRWR